MAFIHFPASFRLCLYHPVFDLSYPCTPSHRFFLAVPTFMIRPCRRSHCPPDSCRHLPRFPYRDPHFSVCIFTGITVVLALAVIYLRHSGYFYIAVTSTFSRLRPGPSRVILSVSRLVAFTFSRLTFSFPSSWHSLLPASSFPCRSCLMIRSCRRPPASIGTPFFLDLVLRCSPRNSGSHSVVSWSSPLPFPVIESNAFLIAGLHLHFYFGHLGSCRFVLRCRSRYS
jgi:hypothetical protein